MLSKVSQKKYGNIRQGPKMLNFRTQKLGIRGVQAPRPPGSVPEPPHVKFLCFQTSCIVQFFKTFMRFSERNMSNHRLACQPTPQILDPSLPIKYIYPKIVIKVIYYLTMSIPGNHPTFGFYHNSLNSVNPIKIM